MTEWAPQVLLPMPPPTQARLAVVGSGAYWRPCGPIWRVSWSRMMPGWTRAHCSSAFTSSTLFRYLLKSITMAWLTVWPARLVPPERGSTGMPSRAANSTTACTSAEERGMTTPTGSIW